MAKRRSVSYYLLLHLLCCACNLNQEWRRCVRRVGDQQYWACTIRIIWLGLIFPDFDTHRRRQSGAEQRREGSEIKCLPLWFLGNWRSVLPFFHCLIFLSTGQYGPSGRRPGPLFLLLFSDDSSLLPGSSPLLPHFFFPQEQATLAVASGWKRRGGWMAEKRKECRLGSSCSPFLDLL